MLKQQPIIPQSIKQRCGSTQRSTHLERMPAPHSEWGCTNWVPGCMVACGTASCVRLGLLSGADELRECTTALTPGGHLQRQSRTDKPLAQSPLRLGITTVQHVGTKEIRVAPSF